MPPAAFEPATPATDRLEILALDSSSTGIVGIRTRNPSEHPQTLALESSATGIVGIRTRNPSERPQTLALESSAAGIGVLFALLL